MQPLTKFRRKIRDHLKDWYTRLVYADWLEENGYEMEANGQRWQVEYKKCPRRLRSAATVADPNNFSMRPRSMSYDWWLGTDESHRLPTTLYFQVCHISYDGKRVDDPTFETAINSWVEFQTSFNADYALAKALEILSIKSTCIEVSEGMKELVL